jgi:hypothetical protein
MISLPLEPVNKTILIDRETGGIDPESIFYSVYQQGLDPRSRLFRYQAGVGYWVYDPQLYPVEAWYEIDVEPPPGRPHPGPWWQGFWFYAATPVTITYTAHVPPSVPEARRLDLEGAASSWLMVGGFGRPPVAYQPDASTWAPTPAAADVVFSLGPDGPWVPTSDCDDLIDDAFHLGWIGLPLSGFTCNVGYYAAGPPQEPFCGHPGAVDALYAGEGYWLSVEDPELWLGVDRTP